MDWSEMTNTERDTHIGAWIDGFGCVPKYLKLLEQGTMSPTDGDRVAASVGAKLVTPGATGYPARVLDTLDISGPLFVRGDLPCGPRVAIVGSRACSHEGERLAKHFAGELGRAGVAIVSGGAIGIDTMSHRAAVGTRGGTIAVLPCGLDSLTPRRNCKLFEEIVASGGALVTEYPPGVTPRKYHFHRRNEVIAAMADAVVVVRAEARSGTMLTARAAQRFARPLLVVPGSPEDRTAAGCLELLRAGAACVRNADDVLVELAALDLVAESLSDACAGLQGPDGEVVHALHEGVKSVDELVQITKKEPAELRGILLGLEMSGFVERLGGGRYRAS